MEKESESVKAFRKLLEVNNTKPDQTEALIASRVVREKSEKKAEIRSWIAIGISFLALIVSILVVIYK